ncbi:nitric oxide synthase-interacting protein-like [Tropilaelaps mercedesae]|uniref:Nitric oxide synthase-interacting protein homolog n=1 Tax=Tropilaelaps mercedesae TaxID=418985 RepID=A0A1V9X662_9ACAR|nr:nitric oxide synthase-interacting protein-like [Tropilaelaps mercedesae]
MTRHAKNCTAGSVYTYHEKMKDMKMGGYGTQSERLGKDAQREFDCCCLTLHPCRDPVITPEGFLYDREAILEYIIKQKLSITKKRKEFERQEKKREDELKHPESKKTKNATTTKTNEITPALPSFWIPTLTPQASVSSTISLKAPESEVLCPMSGQPIRAKKLYPVKWTLLPDDGQGKALIAKKSRYMCAVSHDILGNSVPCAYLKTSGHVVTVECLEKVIKKEWIDPINGAKIKKKDIIIMQRGGTGFSSTNEQLTAAVQRPVIQS